GITAIVIATTRPTPPQPPCKPGVPCAAPPTSPIVLPHLAAATVFASGKEWTSDLGPSLRYPEHWDVIASDKRSLVVKGTSKSGLFLILAVYVQPSTLTPAAAMKARLAKEKGGSFLGVDTDDSDKHVILAPQIGYVRGVAASYHATVDQPPSPS